MQLTALRGDLTTVAVDVLVNAANPGLLGGGGVDGAVHRVGGPEVLAACRAVKATLPGGRLPRGRAVATIAGRLPARWVVHTAGPVWTAAEDRSPVLRSCHTESLRVADGLGARSVAFPAISTGVYGWPLEDAAVQAVTAVRSVAAELAHVTDVRFVLFGEPALQAYRWALGSAEDAGRGLG